ncbi:MAG: heme-binding protein [Verrucomicrobiota bacterium]|nr:heme-binding protein [Verrucomicrobiota bacterium]
MKVKSFWLVASLLGVLGFAFYKLSRFDAEEMPYETRLKDGRFELRRYPAFAVAHTGLRSGRDDSFQRLFDFISGANNRREKIPMTTPVLFERESGARGTMTFLMPEATAQRGVPHPQTSEVELDLRPAAEVAVKRFGGGMREENERQALAELRAWIESRGLVVEGEPIIAYYDSPFIPGPLRRNEAMLRITRR